MGYAQMIGNAAGAPFKAYGEWLSGQTAYQISQANKEMALQDAESKRASYLYEGYKKSMEKNRMLGRQTSVIAAGGFSPSSDTALDIIQRTANEYNVDIGMAGVAGQSAMLRGETEASIYDYMGRSARTAGRMKAWSTLLTVGQGGV